MKKFCSILLAMLLILCCASALAEECKYAGQGSPCEPGWWVDTQAQKHARACFYHVEEKEDINSHVLITPWEPCTLDEGGECTGCGWDYVDEPSYDDYDMYMMEAFFYYREMYGASPVEVTEENGKLTITFKDDFFSFMDDMGFPYGESVMVGTDLNLAEVGGVWTVEVSEYGAGAWMQRMGLLEIGSVSSEGAEITIDGVTHTLGGNVAGVDLDRCQYYKEDAPCRPAWWLKEAERRHARACFYHVEEKEDMSSHVLITPWEDCTLDAESVCTVCGHDYDPDLTQEDYDMMMLESFYACSGGGDNGWPVNVAVDGNRMTVVFTDELFAFMDQYERPYTESSTKETVITLEQSGGEWQVRVSEDGPGPWFQRMNMGWLEIGSIEAEGDAASVQITVCGTPYTLSTSSGIPAERCKYYSPDSPCDIIWWLDSKNKQHCRACKNHVEDKEDPYSYVRLTEWTDCTPGEDYICTGCGWDYSPAQGPSEEDYDAYMVEIYYKLLEKKGVPPMDVTVSGDTLTIKINEQFQMYMLELGIPVTETLLVGTEYTLTQSGGEWTVEASEYGPGAWLQRAGLISISDVQASGGKVTVEIALDGGEPYTLTAGGISPVIIPGDADGDGETGIMDALAVLQMAVGWNNTIDLEAADVNDSGEVDIMDALLILQYSVGWDVELK